MPPILAPLVSSRRFIISVLALLAIFVVQRYVSSITDFQLMLVVIVAGFWVLGDGIRSDLPWFLASNAPLIDKVKALASRPRFIAASAAIGVILGRDRLGPAVTDLRLQLMTIVVSAWILSDSFREAVPPTVASRAAPVPSPAPVQVYHAPAPVPAPAPSPQQASVIPPPPSPQ